MDHQRETLISNYVRMWLRDGFKYDSLEGTKEEVERRTLCNFTMEEHNMVHTAIRAAMTDRMERVRR